MDSRQNILYFWFRFLSYLYLGGYNLPNNTDGITFVYEFSYIFVYSRVIYTGIVYVQLVKRE